MVEKKDFTEYERSLKDFIKKPLVPKKDEFNVFPPEKDIKKSEDQEASSLPVAPKLSMRKKTQFVDFEEAPEGVERIKPGSERWENIVQYFVQEYGDEYDGVSEETIMISVSEYETDEVVNFGEDISLMVDDIIERLEGKGIRIYSSKKIVVGSKILTSTNKKAEVVKVSGDLVYWVSGKDDFGSDFIKDVKLAERKKTAGTWELPFTVEEATKLKNLVGDVEQGNKSQLAQELYDLFGDDELFDDLPNVDSRVAQIIRKHVKDLLDKYENDPTTFKDKLEPEAEEILRSI